MSQPAEALFLKPSRVKHCPASQQSKETNNCIFHNQRINKYHTIGGRHQIVPAANCISRHKKKHTTSRPYFKACKNTHPRLSISKQRHFSETKNQKICCETQKDFNYNSCSILNNSVILQSLSRRDAISLHRLRIIIKNKTH